MKKLTKLLFFLLFSISVLYTLPAAAQCAMCKANVESAAQSKDHKVGAGLNAGIIMLLAMPYIAFAGLGALWYVNSKYRKAKRIHFDK